MRPLVLLLCAWVLWVTPAGAEDSVDLIARSMAQRSPRWLCQPSKIFVCGPRGCTEGELGKGIKQITLDFPGEQYERCDSKGCDRYEMRTYRGGVMTSATPTDGTKALFFRAVNDGSEFVETAFMFTTVLTYFGRCEPRQ